VDQGPQQVRVVTAVLELVDKQLTNVHVQGGRYQVDHRQGGILLATLDRADVGAMEPCPVGESLLRKATFVAQFTYACPKCGFPRLRRRRA
jgi:hypothetical protein